MNYEIFMMRDRIMLFGVEAPMTKSKFSKFELILPRFPVRQSFDIKENGARSGCSYYRYFGSYLLSPLQDRISVRMLFRWWRWWW